MQSKNSLSTSSAGRARRQGLIWLLTIPGSLWSPCLPEGVAYIKGQKEIGCETSYEHWQVLVHFSTKKSLAGVKKIFPAETHAELSRSSASEKYVWKEETRVDGSQFELGIKPVRRNSQIDWDRVWEAAKVGDYSVIPASVW